MKPFNFYSLVFIAFLPTAIYGQNQPVKMSNSGICHAPNSTYYEQTKKFTPYKSLNECLKAGGRMPKK
jgi:hypothetical protein